MFFLIYLFYIQSKVRFNLSKTTEIQNKAVERFVKIKQGLAVTLVPIFIVLALYSFASWFMSGFYPDEHNLNSFASINNIFFEQFFTILIFADVFLLLFSFFLTDEFHKVIRNSGFIISTILIRLSFATTGLLNNALIVCAIVFGICIIFIHNKFEKRMAAEAN
jgi:hypothetical protein